MKKFLLGTTAAVALSAPAVAADLPLKAPPAVAAVVSSWIGPYIGVGVGARSVDADWRTTCLAPLAGPPCPISGALNPALDFPGRFANANPSSFDSTSARVSVYAGFNIWQYQNFVFGLEADIAWANNRDSRVGIPGTFLPGAATADTAGVRDRWEGSLRTRSGYAISPATLIYYTSGLAFIRKEVSATCVTAFPVGWCATVPQTSTVDRTVWGWTLGAGAEWRYSSNWLLRGEYRYSQYRNRDFTLLTAAPIDSLRVEVKEHTHIAYLGLSYFFGRP